jgi:hypothetical protein
MNGGIILSTDIWRETFWEKFVLSFPAVRVICVYDIICIDDVNLETSRTRNHLFCHGIGIMTTVASEKSGTFHPA